MVDDVQKGERSLTMMMIDQHRCKDSDTRFPSFCPNLFVNILIIAFKLILSNLNIIIIGFIIYDNSQEVEPYLGGGLLLGDLFSFGDCVPRRHPVKELVMDIGE